MIAGGQDGWPVHVGSYGIIGSLNLRRGIFSPTSAYGHFGRPGSADQFTWEQLDRSLTQHFMSADRQFTEYLKGK